MNKVIEDEQKHDAEENARIQAERAAGLGRVQHGGPPPHPAELASKHALIQGLTPSDILCDPFNRSEGEIRCV